LFKNSCFFDSDDFFHDIILEYGDLEFDATKFPDPREMIRQLHRMGFKVTVWITPFASANSRAFRKGVEKGYWVKGGDNQNPALVTWWNVRKIICHPRKIL
jgi:alpha-glucosidase (family GH31 glycosyl hydrolase)